MNHRTTTTLLVVIAVATLLASGIVIGIVGSNHSAFAHKYYDKFNKEDKSGSDGNQYLKCIVVESGGISDNSCNNRDGATPSTSTCNPSTVGGITATPTDGTCKATILFSTGDEAVRVFTEECAAIPPPTMFITNDETSVTCIFPSTPPA
jgi:hypothetical protein